jgi:hypothetical protein
MVLDGVADIASSFRRSRPVVSPTPRSWNYLVCFATSPATHSPRGFQAGVLHDYGDYVPIAMWGTPLSASNFLSIRSRT